MTRREAPHMKHGKNSPALTAVMALMLIYTLLPLVWLLINSTKDAQSLFSSFGLGFGHGFRLWSNIHNVLTVNGGIYLRWFANTVLYAVVGAGGAAVIATAGGYALAKYNFRGRTALFAIVLGAISVPGTALAVPTYLLFAKLNLINTPWAVIIPSLASPFGLYLMRIYAIGAIPDSLLEAARIDGAGEFRVFRTISLRLLVMATSQHKAQAAEFANWLNSSPQGTQDLANLGLFPATTSLLSNSSFLNASVKVLGGQQANKILATSASEVPASWQYLPFQVYANSVYVDTLGQNITAGANLSPGLTAWQQRIASYGQSNGFTVKTGS